MTASGGVRPSVRANAVAIAVAQVLAKGAGFATIVVLTRVLPIEDFGRYTLAFAFVAVLAPLADLGVDLHVTRIVARGAERAAAMLGASLALKLCLGAVLVAVAWGGARLLGYESPTPLMVVLAALTVVGGTLANSWFAVLRAAQRMDREALSTVATRLLSLAGALVAVAFGAGVVAVSAAQAVAGAVALVLVAQLARGVIPAPQFAGAAKQWPGLVRGGLPFALTAVVVTIYFRLDTVMLSLMSGEKSTAIYGACASLLFAWLLLSQALVTAVFPVIAEAGTLADERVRRVMRRAMILSLAASLPLGIGASAFAAPALELCFGREYRAGSAALVLLAWTAPVLFLTNLCGHALAATGRQKDVLVISTVNAVLNVSLNLVLIPRFDAAGAALATLLTEVAGLTMFGLLLRTVLGGVMSWGALARVAAVNAVFALLLTALRPLPWPVAIVLVLAVAVYLGLLLLAGVVRAADLRGFRPSGAEAGAS